MTWLPFFRISLLLVTSAAALFGTKSFAMDLACARTPAQAVKMYQFPETASELALKDGYRITTVHRDPLLHQRWAMVTNCNHPERPALALLLSDSQLKFEEKGQQVQNPFPVVHAGDLVQLWSQERDLRIEVAGRAEESGAIGSRVRVRVVRPGLDRGQEQVFLGVVRGPGNVEIER